MPIVPPSYLNQSQVMTLILHLEEASITHIQKEIIECYARLIQTHVQIKDSLKDTSCAFL